MYRQDELLNMIDVEISKAKKSLDSMCVESERWLVDSEQWRDAWQLLRNWERIKKSVRRDDILSLSVKKNV